MCRICIERSSSPCKRVPRLARSRVKPQEISAEGKRQAGQWATGVPMLALDHGIRIRIPASPRKPQVQRVRYRRQRGRRRVQTRARSRPPNWLRFPQSDRTRAVATPCATRPDVRKLPDRAHARSRRHGRRVPRLRHDAPSTRRPESCRWPEGWRHLAGSRPARGAQRRRVEPSKHLQLSSAAIVWDVSNDQTPDDQRIKSHEHVRCGLAIIRTFLPSTHQIR